MSRIRSRDTGPEILLRRAVWAAGLRYRVHAKLPGHPDLSFSAARLAVFVDGCFWHGCPLHSKPPSTNQGYWGPKLARNEARDRQAEARLADMGWSVIRLWEHEVRRDIAGSVERILSAVRGRGKIK